jgi:hypothetical protein
VQKSYMLRLLTSYFFTALSIVALAQDAGPRQTSVLLHSRAQLVVVDVIVTGNGSCSRGIRISYLCGKGGCALLASWPRSLPSRICARRRSYGPW